MYVWMWATGILFFLITFTEQNLWQIAWFRESYLREVTVQWKANGSMVGSWNQMIYGTSLYLMVKISGNEELAKGKTVFFFYMLGLTNLMFNWGHHIYNVPTANWIRNTSYVISMTEWIFLIKMIREFSSTLDTFKRLKHLIAYRFMIAGEFWVFMNLLLALAMSVPAINRYTHGTHITVAHSMGATIGINTMFLLASFTYLLKIDLAIRSTQKTVIFCYWVCQCSLLAFWMSLIAAGAIKGYRSVALNIRNFQEVMQPTFHAIKGFAYAGLPLALGLITIAVIYIRRTIELRGEATV
jgi:nitric oxide reductase subunit B